MIRATYVTLYTAVATLQSRLVSDMLHHINYIPYVSALLAHLI